MDISAAVMLVVCPFNVNRAKGRKVWARWPKDELVKIGRAGNAEGGSSLMIYLRRDSVLSIYVII